MSKFTEEWQKLRKDMGHMVGVMESMAPKYNECSNLEETFYNKGFIHGQEAQAKKTKAEICNDCKYKATAENCCDYAFVINLYARLPARQRDVVLSLMQELSRGK